MSPSIQKKFSVDGISVLAEAPANWNRKLAVIVAHGAGNGMDSPFMRDFAGTVLETPALAVRFNFPYMEAGRRAPDPVPRLEAAYRAVIDGVVDEFRPDTLVIGGKSMGGRIASRIAPGDARVQGLIFLGYPLHAPGREDKLRDAHLDQIGCPMLFVSGTRDKLARRDLIENVARRLGSRATLVEIEGGDHSFTKRKSDPGGRGVDEARQAMSGWLRGSF